MPGRDDVPTVDPRVSAHWWAQKLVEGLVESGAPEEEVWAAIDELTKHAKEMAKLAFSRRGAAKLIKSEEHRPRKATGS